MLSIIISSYQPDLFAALEKNIAETCGISYEIVRIDNPGLMGICEAYNKGAAMAKFENLLFLHEDVSFETKGWGNILESYLRENKPGCLGVAGSAYLPNVPCGWWMVEGYAYSHITHFNKNTAAWSHYTFEGNKDGLKEVRFIDGVFIACTKNRWMENKFDERLKGFHAYDVSFSIKMTPTSKNYITNAIDLVHYSAGSPGKAWLTQLLLNRRINARFFSQKIIDNSTEIKAYQQLARELIHKKFDRKEIVTNLINFLSLRRLGMMGYLKALKTIYWSLKK